MFKKLKKHFNKILIACLTIISSIAIFSSINKTYAYQTDSFTYTLDTNDITFTTLTFDNVNYTGIMFDSSNNNLANAITLKMKDNKKFTYGDYILFNFFILNSSGNRTYYQQDNLQFYLDNGTSWSFSIYGTRSTIYNSNNYFTNTIFNKFLYFGNSNSFKCLIPQVSNDTYRIFIFNLDFVKQNDIGLQQYYETYYGQIEDNYNNLLSNYNDLQNEYNDLETNYNTLDDNYNNLQSNYDLLMEDFNAVNNVYKYGAFAFATDAYLTGTYDEEDNEGDPYQVELNLEQNKTNINTAVCGKCIRNTKKSIHMRKFVVK